MRPTNKLVITTLAAIVFMAFAVSIATARRFEISERSFLAAWTAASPLEFNAAGQIFRCPVTLDGSFHSRTLSKRNEQLVGYINQAIVANSACTNAHATMLTETLPWHIRYRSFTGTLPNITAILINLVGMRFNIEESGGLQCLSGTEEAHPLVTSIERETTAGRVTGMRVLPEFTIPLGGGFLCSLAGEGRFEGRAAVSGLAVGRPAVTVRLVQ